MKLYDEDEMFSPEVRTIGRVLFWTLAGAAIVYIILPGLWMIVKGV